MIQFIWPWLALVLPLPWLLRRYMQPLDASSEADVKRLNDEAGLPYSRIVQALDLTP